MSPIHIAAEAQRGTETLVTWLKSWTFSIKAKYLDLAHKAIYPSVLLYLSSLISHYFTCSTVQSHLCASFMPACDGPTQPSNQAKKRGIPGAQVTNRFSSHASSDHGQNHWWREWSPEKPVRNWEIQEAKLNNNVVSAVASSTWSSAVWT